MRSMTHVVVAALVMGWSASAEAQSPSGELRPLALDDLARMALERNPTVKQAAAGVAMAKGRARQAGLFPNPTVGYTGEEISGGPIMRWGEHGFFVEQVIPLGGKLKLGRHLFEREVAEAEAILDAQRLRVQNAVRALYYEALARDRRVEVRAELAKLTAEAGVVSRQLVNVGQADRTDLLESEIEAHQAQLALVAARHEHERTWQHLAQVVGDPGLTPRPLEGSIDRTLPDIDRQRALDAILRESPELKMGRAAVERADLAVTRARRELVPDLVVRAGPRYNRELLERGERPVGWEAFADVGVTIPLFNRNQGNVETARAELARAREEVTRLELALRARLADRFEQYLTARRRAEVYRADILPRAEEAHRLFLQRFREMGAAYPQVLIARRTLFQMTEQHLDALAAAWQAAVEIEGLLLADGLEPPAKISPES